MAARVVDARVIVNVPVQPCTGGVSCLRFCGFRRFFVRFLCGFAVSIVACGLRFFTKIWCGFSVLGYFASRFCGFYRLKTFKSARNCDSTERLHITHERERDFLSFTMKE